MVVVVVVWMGRNWFKNVTVHNYVLILRRAWIKSAAKLANGKLKISHFVHYFIKNCRLGDWLFSA